MTIISGSDTQKVETHKRNIKRKLGCKSVNKKGEVEDQRKKVN